MIFKTKHGYKSRVSSFRKKEKNFPDTWNKSLHQTLIEIYTFVYTVQTEYFHA